MCLHRKPDAALPPSTLLDQALAEALQARPLPPAPAAAAPASGSRRRRLWELDRHAHCPVLGVCIPIGVLRRLLDKALDPAATRSDYGLHCAAVSESRTRGRLSELLQQHLDRRYEAPLRRTAALKSAEALAAWWAEALEGPDLPGAFWATLTHPRCTPQFEEQVLGQVHMLQHQVGVARRVDLGRFESLIEENAVLGRALAAAQERCLRQAAAGARRVEDLEAELLRQRALTLARDTELARQHEARAELEAAAPGLRERHALTLSVGDLRGRLQDLQREFAAMREEAQRQRVRAEGLQARLDTLAIAPVAPASAAPAGEAGGRPLADRAVLCVGGRPATVPQYRVVIERRGARFLHHDGGDEDNPLQLDHTLAAADLVICQTGCVSHDAYWRVKDHCRRTGKRCVFVESPSRAALERALAGLVLAGEGAAPARGGHPERPGPQRRMPAKKDDSSS